MSGVPTSIPKNAPLPATPAPVPAPPPRRSYGWLIACLLAGVAAAGYWSYQQHATASIAVVPIRTAAVASSPVERSIRLTGVTAAENFYSITAPSLRGNRNGNGRTSVTGSSAAGSSVASISSSSSSASSGAVASGLSSALKAATSRSATSKSSASASGSSTSTAAGAGSSDSLGSTASALPGGSGGPPSAGSGGGGGDFQLVLQKTVPPGMHVRKGQQVAEFDRQFMINRLDDYRASSRQAEDSFKKVMANLEVTLKAHDQQVSAAKAAVDKARLDMGTIAVRSPIDAERLKLALEESEAQYKQLMSEVPLVEVSQKSQVRIDELDLKQSQLELKRAEANADRLALKAGIDGLAVMQTTFRGAEFGQYQEGDVVGPGVLFMTIVDPRSMVVNAAINQVDAERLRIGAKARVRFDAYPNLELPAHVYSIGAMTRSSGFRANFVRDIPVRLKLDKLDGRVIPDLSVSADVILESSPAAPAIPLSAVQHEPSNGEPFVYVRHEDVWERRRVQLGLANFVQVSVTSGLKSGEVVALEPPPADASPKDQPNL